MRKHSIANLGMWLELLAEGTGKERSYEAIGKASLLAVGLRFFAAWARRPAIGWSM